MGPPGKPGDVSQDRVGNVSKLFVEVVMRLYRNCDEIVSKLCRNCDEIVLKLCRNCDEIVSKFGENCVEICDNVEYGQVCAL